MMTALEEKSETLHVEIESSEDEPEFSEIETLEKIKFLKVSLDDMGPGVDSEEESNVHNQILICSANLKDFERFKRKYETVINCRMFLQGNQIFIYESPNSVHGSCQAEVIRQLSNESIQRFQSALHVCGSEDLLIDNSSTRSADVTLIPRNRVHHAHHSSDHQGSPYPTLVVEIGVSRTLSYLHSLHATYFSLRTKIKLYLAIKIGKRRQNGTLMMMALLYERRYHHPTRPHIISFGTALVGVKTRARLDSFNPQTIVGYGISDTQLCPGPGTPNYVIQIPSNKLYHDVPGGVPGNLPAHLVIDLYFVQQNIINALAL